MAFRTEPEPTEFTVKNKSFLKHKTGGYSLKSKGINMLLEVDGKRAVLHIKPNPKIFAILPRLEGRRTWLKGGGMSFESTGRNIEILREVFPQIELKDLSPVPEFDVTLVKSKYNPKTKPYPHQLRALEKARTKDTFALFMEQGTGKTKVAIDRAGELWSEGLITGVLIIAKKGVHRQWIASQVPEHFGGPWTGQFFQNGKWHDVEGEEGEAPLHFASINFDGAKAKKGLKACLDFVEAHRGKVFIIGDETQEIKNARSSRHNACEQIKRASASRFRLALTGTPIAKDLTDEWAQLRWLNENILGIRYETAFRAEYCIMGGFENRQVIAHKNIERFRERVDPFTFRATKDELGISPKVHKRWEFDLANWQKKIIADLKQDLKTQIETGEIFSASTAVAAMIKIQQASNGYLTDEDGQIIPIIKPEKNPRLNALMEVLEARPGKTIIWARFRQDIRLIGEALTKAKISFVEYYGATSDKDRSAAVESFLDPEGATIFLSNPQSGGTGLNLQGGCNHAIYYSNSFNAIDRWQSEDRIHRIGTNGDVLYTDLVCKGAVDKLILSNLKRKQGISELALGEIIKTLEEE